MIRVLVLLLINFALTSVVFAQDARENFKFAKFYYDEGNYFESLVYIDKAIEQDPEYTSAYLLRANVYHELQQYYNAILDINRVLRIDTAAGNIAAEYYLTRGKAYLELKEYADASKDFEKSNSLSNGKSETFYCQAKLNMVTFNYLEALESIDKAIQLEAKNSKYYAERATIKFDFYKPTPDSEEYQGILSDINIAISLAPENHEYYLIRSNFLNSMGKNEDAQNDYDIVIKLSPEKGEAYTSRGVFKMNKYEYRSAVLDFTKSILIDPENESNYRFRGLCYNNLNNLDEARKDFSKSIDLLRHQLKQENGKSSIKNTLAETYILRGHCLNLMGNNALACRDFLAAHNLGIRKGLNYYRKYCGIY